MISRYQKRVLVAAIGIIFCLFLWSSLDILKEQRFRITQPRLQLTPISKVWQIGPPDFDPRKPHIDNEEAHFPLDHTSTWLSKDGQWEYNFLRTDHEDSFVREHFKSYPEIVQVFTETTRPIIRSDFLRYLAIFAKGGVYADADTKLLKPLQEWIPQEFLTTTKAIIGIEFDKRNDPLPKSRLYEVSFAQYVFAATAGHPIMLNMAQDLTDALLERAEAKEKTISELDFDNAEIILISGPRAMTRIVYDHMSNYTASDITWKNVTMLDKPKLIGDVLILPINAFGSGQAHSGSSDKSPDRLVRHLFAGSWRDGKDKGQTHA